MLVYDKTFSVRRKVLSTIKRTSKILQGSVTHNGHDTNLLFHGTNQNFFTAQICFFTSHIYFPKAEIHFTRAQFCTCSQHKSTLPWRKSSLHCERQHFQVPMIEKQNIQFLLHVCVVRVDAIDGGIRECWGFNTAQKFSHHWIISVMVSFTIT